jgi:periplasmic divalent cation tolerance protein
MTPYIQVVTTASNRDDADKIARTLVERRLAACVQISGPIVSNYRWQGAIETADEYQCNAKSRLDLFVQLEQAIREVHPYQTPEILATQIVAGNAAYLSWLETELLSPG